MSEHTMREARERVKLLADEAAAAEKKRFECWRYIGAYEDGPQEQADLKRLTEAATKARSAFHAAVDALASSPALPDVELVAPDLVQQMRSFLLAHRPDDGSPVDKQFGKMLAVLAAAPQAPAADALDAKRWRKFCELAEFEWHRNSREGDHGSAVLTAPTHGARVDADWLTSTIDAGMAAPPAAQEKP